MLEYLRLKNAPAFDDEVGADVGPFAPVTFLFGANGSGKTTLSRALAQPDLYPGTTLSWDTRSEALGVRVYNRDFVNKTLTEAENLPGVFLLGTASVDIQAELDVLAGPEGEVSLGEQRLLALKDTLRSKLEEISVARNQLKDAAWAKRAEVPTELSAMFSGYNNNKDRFLERLLDVATVNPATKDTFGELAMEAAAVLDTDASPISELPLGPSLNFAEIPGVELLGTPVVGSAEVHLAPLIQKLENADWVRHGQHYLGQSQGTCPFCQQEIVGDLSAQLELYFDDRYNQQVSKLKALEALVSTWSDQWDSHHDQLMESRGKEHLDTERFQIAWLKLKHDIDEFVGTVRQKINNPSGSVDIVDPSPQIKALRELIENANAGIRAHNSRVANRATVRTTLLERCWVVFCRVTLAAEVARYEGLMPGLRKAEVALAKKIADQAEEVGSKKIRLRELQSQVTSSKPVIERINSLLDSVGFHSFRLSEASGDTDGYSLLRPDGAVVGDTLSEGERTFITFLYFAQSLEGAPQDPSEPSGLIAVIDDPISSLDSDVLYAVSTLVRKIVAMIEAGKGRVRQIVVMTHNAHFHKEVTYLRQGQKSGAWRYGVVRKRLGSPSEVVFSSDNPVQTAYNSLWDEVNNALKDPHASAIGLQNTLRRILETYFRVLGGVNDFGIVAEFKGEDRAICRSLFSWVNSGSHAIFDELDYAPGPATTEAYLRVFREIFVNSHQLGHYRMMTKETEVEVE